MVWSTKSCTDVFFVKISGNTTWCNSQGTVRIRGMRAGVSRWFDRKALNAWRNYVTHVGDISSLASLRESQLILNAHIALADSLANSVEAYENLARVAEVPQFSSKINSTAVAALCNSDLFTWEAVEATVRAR